MRRAFPVLFATVVAIVLLLSFHTSPQSAVVGARSGGGSSSVPPTTVAGAGPPPTTGPGSASGVHTYTGGESQNPYGPVQVRITVSGSKLTDVVALELPSDRARSQRISAVAEPILRTEALQGQSARIDVVSGATFTSESYAQSLQSALDQAHLGG